MVSVEESEEISSAGVGLGVDLGLAEEEWLEQPTRVEIIKAEDNKIE